MRLSGFKWVRSMNSILGLCLCLVLIGLTTAGAIVYTNRSYSGGMLPDVQVCKAEPLVLNDVDSALSAIGGNKPVIQVFKATPMILDSPTSAAVYTFKVKLATNVVINEAGANIKSISNPSGATLNGTATGLPASAITTDASGQFVCTIVASNEYGTDTKALTLSLAKELLSTGAGAGPTGSENETGGNKSKWLDQLPISPPPKSIQSYINKNEPNFFKCPSGCENCLKPGDAASLGFTQKCSEERCYYSPDGQQNWYCYKPTPGWCCANGKVNPSTKAECDKLGGFWSTTQAEATRACQPVGWCCAGGQVGQTTQAQCAQVGGSYWSTNQNEALQACQPIGWCCRDGQVYSATRAQCAQVGGSYWSTNQNEALQACQPVLCWCCSGGKVYQTTKAQCAQSGGTCYSTESQATAGCRQTTPTTPKTPYLR